MTRPNFQAGVVEWCEECFGPDEAFDKKTRAFRFVEEALELAQAVGVTPDEVQQLLRYVYGRPVGHVPQEIGGTMITLAALSEAHEQSLDECALRGLAECWTRIEQIRAKNANKPYFGSLPGKIE